MEEETVATAVVDFGLPAALPSPGSMTHHDRNRGVVEAVREHCAEVAAAARRVRIREEQIAPYAASLPEAGSPPERPRLDPGERLCLAAYWLTLDAINFGSGWFPTLKKHPGHSGYHTISERLRRRFTRLGGWSAQELTAVTQTEMARVLGQDPAHELMELFAASLRNLGQHLLAEHDGSFLGPIEAAAGSATAFVEILASWECFADSSPYGGREVPFLKRAQIAAADLTRAGAAAFTDLDALTMFADNLVPHVLRLDGILEFDPALVERVERGELIVHGSPEEVEMRACAVHAVELIVAASPVATTAADIDQRLWLRGQGRAYKARPRPRSRCTAY
jgi:hypothetical protein